MSRVSLKELASLVSNLRLQGEDIAAKKLKYKKSEFLGANKPDGFADDEEYTILYKLGPIVDECVDGIAALEEEIKDIHTYISGQLGSEADRMVLPPKVAFTDPAGNLYEIITFNEDTKASQINIDEMFVGANSLYVNNKKVISDESDTINITTDDDQNLKIKTAGSGILQIVSEAGGIQFTSAGNTVFNSDLTVNSANSISGSNATTGLQLGKTRMNGDLLLQANSIIISDQGKIAFGGDSTNTYIAANTDSPEDLELHADQDLILRPDGNVVVGSTAVMNASGTWIGPSSGLKGDVGLKGAQGPQGKAGTNGSGGAKGATGAQGPQGASIVDARLEDVNLIIEGEAFGSLNVGRVYGNTGAQGPQGDKGAQGAQGTAGTNGSNGSKGATGDKGAQGTAGTNGSNGSKGATGDKGAQGTAGTNGSNGSKGATGDKGAQGTAGTNGSNGSKGATGAQGLKEHPL